MIFQKITSFRKKYHFLSNFYPVEIVYEGKNYRTAEHAFQAAKSVNDNDKEKIRDAKTPTMAKRMGRKVQLRPDWDSQKLIIMENILKIKFEPKHMRDLLLETKSYEIIEQNIRHDVYWGACVCKKHKTLGKNMLGKLLMKIRDKEN